MSRLVVTRGALKLVGSGCAFPVCPGPTGPKPVITQADVLEILAATVQTPRQQQAVERLVRTSGVESRHWCHWIGGPVNAAEPDLTDLALAAAQSALAQAKLAVHNLDMLIFAHSTSVLPTIAGATPLSERLGYHGPSFDLKAGCAGGLYALQQASLLLGAGYGRVLVVAGDTMSKYVDPYALSGFSNVGDGAGALVLEAADRPNFACAVEGEYSTWSESGVFGPLPPRAGVPDDYVFRGRPTGTRDLIQARYDASVRGMLAATDTPMSKLVRWIPHQTSAALLEAVAAGWGADAPPFFSNHARYGNTGSGSLLIALHEAIAEGTSGLVALSALGGGMRWGTALWELCS